jgi:hypothetical protein
MVQTITKINELYRAEFGVGFVVPSRSAPTRR